MLKIYSKRWKNKQIRIFLRIIITFLLLLSLWNLNTKNSQSDIWLWFIFDASESVRILHNSDINQLMRFYQNEANITWKQFSYEAKQVGCIFFGDGVEIAISHNKNNQLVLPLPVITGKSSQLSESIQLALLNTPDFIQPYFVIWTDAQFRESYLEQTYQEIQKRHNFLDKKKYNSCNFIFRPAFPEKKNFYDVAIENIIVEESIPKSGYVRGHAIITSNHSGKFFLKVTSSTGLFQQEFQLFQPGNTTIYFSLPISGKRTIENIRVEVFCTTFLDKYLPNNFVETFVRITTKNIQIWILGDAIFPNFPNINFIKVSPEFLSQKSWQDFPDAIILAQVSAIELGEPSLKNLQKYVLKGGSVLMLGSEDTLGPGQYANTDMEKALPVWCIPQQKTPLVLLILLDISGSMAENYQGKEKILVAKQGLSAAIQYLTAQDYFGIIGFRQNAEQLIPLQRWEKSDLNILEKKIYPQGSTNISSAFSIAMQNFDQIKVSKDSRQHILLISDGQDNQSDPKLWQNIQILKDKGISISVVATGLDTQQILAKIAQIGGGKFYETGKLNLSEILLQAIQNLQVPSIQTGEFPVQLGKDIDWLISLSKEKSIIDKYPAIKKFVPVIAKDWGKTILTFSDFPLLVVGYYGMGRTAVFSSNFKETWIFNEKNIEESAKQKWTILLQNLLSWLAYQESSKQPALIQNNLDFETRHLGQKKIPSWPIIPFSQEEKSNILFDIFLLLAMLLFLIERAWRI